MTLTCYKYGVFYNDLDGNLCEVRQVNGAWVQSVHLTVTLLFKNIVL